MLEALLDGAPVALLSSPSSTDDLGKLLREAEFRVLFLGFDPSGRTALAVVTRASEPALETPVPPEFRAVALMPTFNEEDVLEGSIRALAADGVRVYVIDNWSTDRTYSIAERLAGEEVVGVERFPVSGPTSRYEWKAILERTEELAGSLDADWFLHVDADERPRSPWPELTLRDALYYVDRCGFSCVDFTRFTFRPVDDTFRTGDLEGQFRFFELPGAWDDRHNERAWKNLGVRVVRTDAGGHLTHFQGRRLYPFTFLLKHYPIRSQAHGERKVLRERAVRWSPAERSIGWHSHYDGVEPDHRFLRDPGDLIEFDEARFHEDFLLQRLGVVVVEPWSASPEGLE